MRYQVLNYEKKGNVALIHSVDRVFGPVSMDQLIDELTDLCTEILSNGETRVIILGGIEENLFSMESALPGTALRSLSEPIAKLDLPVIASINGDALGQRLELVLACDKESPQRLRILDFLIFRKGSFLGMEERSVYPVW